MLLYPAIVVLALFVILVILIMFKYGMRWCNLRHTLDDSDSLSIIDRNNSII